MDSSHGLKVKLNQDHNNPIQIEGKKQKVPNASNNM